MASPEGKSLSERYQNLSEEEYAFFQEVGDLARDMAERGETLWKRRHRATRPRTERGGPLALADLGDTAAMLRDADHDAHAGDGAAVVPLDSDSSGRPSAVVLFDKRKYEDELQKSPIYLEASLNKRARADEEVRRSTMFSKYIIDSLCKRACSGGGGKPMPSHRLRERNTSRSPGVGPGHRRGPPKTTDVRGEANKRESS